MQLQVEGILSGSCDLANVEKPLNQAKEISLYVVFGEESHKKIGNVCDNYGKRKLPVFEAPEHSGIDGYEIIIRTQSINGKLGRKMLETSREKWASGKFLVKFKIANYSFKSKLEKNFGEVINGCNFILEHIEYI